MQATTELDPRDFIHFIGEGTYNSQPHTFLAATREELDAIEKEEWWDKVKTYAANAGVGIVTAITVLGGILYAISGKVKDDKGAQITITVSIVSNTEVGVQINNWIAGVTCQVGDILREFGKVLIKKGQEVLSAAAKYGNSALPYIGAAAAGVVIGCALGALKKYEREIMTPSIARLLARTLSSITGAPEAEFKSITNFFVEIFDITFTLLLAASSVATGAAVGYMTAGVAGAIIGGTIGLGTYLLVGHT